MNNTKELTVYYYDLLTGTGMLIADTKYCYSSTASAIARGRSLQKEYRAARVRIESAETFNVYWL
jgi:hypothetical protein